MNKISYPYHLWEDFINGMFSLSHPSPDTAIEQAQDLLRDPEMFFKVGIKVMADWPISSDENLSNASANRRAWIGQASCCYWTGVPETLTRKAWGRLSHNEKAIANNVADKIIRIYERRNRSIHQGLGIEMLF